MEFFRPKLAVCPSKLHHQEPSLTFNRQSKYAIWPQANAVQVQEKMTQKFAISQTNFLTCLWRSKTLYIIGSRHLGSIIHRLGPFLQRYPGGLRGSRGQRDPGGLDSYRPLHATRSLLVNGPFTRSFVIRPKNSGR